MRIQVYDLHCSSIFYVSRSKKKVNTNGILKSNQVTFLKCVWIATRNKTHVFNRKRMIRLFIFIYMWVIQLYFQNATICFDFAASINHSYILKIMNPTLWMITNGSFHMKSSQKSWNLNPTSQIFMKFWENEVFHITWKSWKFYCDWISGYLFTAPSFFADFANFCNAANLPILIYVTKI